MGSVLRVHVSRWVFERGFLACQLVFFCDTESVYWCSGYFSTLLRAKEEYMSGFSLLDQRQWIQSERQRIEFLGTLHLFYVRGGIWSLMEWFFCLLSSLWRQLKSQCGGVRVGYLGTLHLFHVRGGIFVSRGGEGGGAVRRLMSM